MAASLAVGMLLLAMAGHSSGAQWCVCKEGLSDSALQKTLDYACGAGADCSPTHQNGACFNPNTVRAHCNYAVNSFFQKKGQTAGSCDFAGTASVTQSDPSSAGCAYPASASATTNAPSGTNPTPTVNTPTGTSPLITTPTGGGVGVGGGSGGINGINNGLGPTGSGINTDGTSGSSGISVLVKKSSPTTLVLSSLTAVLLLRWWA